MATNWIAVLITWPFCLLFSIQIKLFASPWDGLVIKKKKCIKKFHNYCWWLPWCNKQLIVTRITMVRGEGRKWYYMTYVLLITLIVHNVGSVSGSGLLPGFHFELWLRHLALRQTVDCNWYRNSFCTLTKTHVKLLKHGSYTN